MTKRSTAIVFVISLLTLGGFVIVSNLASTARLPLPAKPLLPQPSATTTPQALTSPQPIANKTSSAEGQWRSDLVQAQNLLDQIASNITAGDWAAAQTSFNEFNTKAKQLPSSPQLNHPEISPVMQDFISLYKLQLGRSLSEQNAQPARIALNQLYGIIGEQRVRFGVRGWPLEFQRLRFLLREVEIWSAANDEEILKMRKSALMEAWKDVRPVIVAKRSGTEPASHFDELINKLGGAQSTDLAALLPELNKEVERMGNLFPRPSRPAGSPSVPTRTNDDD